MVTLRLCEVIVLRATCHVQTFVYFVRGTKYVFITPAAVPSGPLHPSDCDSEGTRDGVVPA